MASHLHDRVLVITGAAGGFGALLAAGAAARGAKVVCSDIDETGLPSVVDRITADGGTASSFVADVADLERMHALVAHAVDTHGAIDVMVNNAGTMPLAFFADHAKAAEAWSRCIDINIKGVLHGMIAAHDPMMAQGRGHVVNLSSIYGNHPVGGAAVYGASKAAVAWMSESLRLETQGRIKVTIVRPTGVPATGLGGGIVNGAAVAGILNEPLEDYMSTLGAVLGGEGDPALTDNDDVRYAALAPEELVEQILYAIDQPWGVSIGDITVRATGDPFRN